MHSDCVRLSMVGQAAGEGRKGDSCYESGYNSRCYWQMSNAAQEVVEGYREKQCKDLLSVLHFLAPSGQKRFLGSGNLLYSCCCGVCCLSFKVVDLHLCTMLLCFVKDCVKVQCLPYFNRRTLVTLVSSSGSI